MAAVGATVMYCREDYVGKVDEYEAVITAVYEDNSCDLLVHYANDTYHNAPGIRYDPDGKPSSWHLKGK